MRLTLRTMLAYMDGVLSPADAEELRRKIELNEGAAGIMQRVRDVTCRMRLGAPKVDSHGMGGDANAVAEYLNDLMPSDRVPEFERVCLESDARLAEVAACHHILALVLSEPAEVDPEMRRRLYGLIDLPERHAEAPPVAEPPVAVEVEAAAPPKTRRKLGVPEYLREGSPSRGWVKWAIGVSALLVLGAIGAVAAVGPQQLLSRLGVAPAGREVASNDSAPNENAADGDSRTPSGANEEDSATEDGAGDKAATPSPREDEESAAADAEEATSDDANTAPSLAPVSEDADAATSEEDAAPAPPTPDETANAATSDEAEATSVEEGASEPEVAEGAPSPGANEMGVVYIQDKAVLLRYSSAEEIWKRLSQGDGVAQGDRLMSLPHFRPGVTLSNGVGIYFRGAAQVVLEGPDVDGTPGVRMMFGRLVLMPNNERQSPVRLLIGGDEYLISFLDFKSALCVEVLPQLVDGSDPEKTPPQRKVDFYLSRERISWQKGAAPAIELMGPLRWTTDPTQPAAVNEAPDWIQKENQVDGESTVAPTIEQNLVADRPVVVSLKEAAVHRKRELRSLAAKCLALVGEYDDFVMVLNDRTQSPAWDGQIEELRIGMARSPEDAAKVRAALEKSRMGDAQGLYRMLWGYNEEQFHDDGAAGDLLADLEHPDLDYRVLAYWNLRQLTGARHPFDPREEDNKSRKDRVELWRRKVAQLLKEKGGG